MNQRDHEIRVRVNDAELASLDAHRGSLSRAGYVRSLLREPPSREQIATREEVMALLSEQGRAGKVQALLALERALRNAPEPGDSFDDDLKRLLED
jgi:hypothetical protein